jgi:hypothetical protein
MRSLQGDKSGLIGLWAGGSLCKQSLGRNRGSQKTGSLVAQSFQRDGGERT